MRKETKEFIIVLITLMIITTIGILIVYKIDEEVYGIKYTWEEYMRIPLIALGLVMFPAFLYIGWGLMKKVKTKKLNEIAFVLVGAVACFFYVQMKYVAYSTRLYNLTGLALCCIALFLLIEINQRLEEVEKSLLSPKESKEVRSDG